MNEASLSMSGELRSKKFSVISFGGRKANNRDAVQEEGKIEERMSFLLLI